MKSEAKTIQRYLDELPAERTDAFNKLRETILANLPKGFVEEMNYGNIGYVVPHSIYPNGYHCDPKLPLPFAGIASQKNFIGLYHMGMYSDAVLMKWFVNEFPKHSKAKPDMGKSCIRFKKFDQIPYKLIGELMKKMSVAEWISLYEENYLKTKSSKN